MVARARRSPSTRLYSLVPRSSQWPSTSTSMLPFDRSHAALASRSRAASGRMVALSKSKWMPVKLAVSAKSFGGAGAGGAGAAAGASWAGAAGAGATDCGTPVGAGADAWLRAGRLAQPTTASTVATIRTGRRSGSARLTYKDLLLTHGDGPAPPTLVAGESNVLPGHACCAGAVTNREPHVSARGERSGLGLPRRPLVARSAAGNESDKSGGAQRRQCEVPESHSKASSDVTVVTPQVQGVYPIVESRSSSQQWERTCRALEPGYPRLGHDGPRGPRSHPAPGTVAPDLD